MQHRQNIGIVAKAIEHRIEQRLREHRGAQIADALGVDRVMHRAIIRAVADADRQRLIQPLAHLGPLLARHGQQFGIVVGGQRADEAAMAVALDYPAVPRFGQQPAPQFDHRGRAALGQLTRGGQQQIGHTGTVGQHPAANSKAAGGQQPPEQR